MKKEKWNTRTGSSTYLREAIAIWVRDLRGEFRTRYAINAIILFSVTTLIAVSFSIGAYRMGEAEKPFLYAVLLWIILMFSAFSGLSRSFVKEQESGTMDILRLTARPQAVFLGKLLFNLTLLGALELVIVPLFIVFMKYEIKSPCLFISMVVSTGFALGAATTIVAAMIAQASIKGALFPALSFPLILPLMITAIKGFERSAIVSAVSGWPEVRFAIAYMVVMVTVSMFLFPLIWEE